MHCLYVTVSVVGMDRMCEEAGGAKVFSSSDRQDERTHKKKKKQRKGQRQYLLVSYGAYWASSRASQSIHQVQISDTTAIRR